MRICQVVFEVFENIFCPPEVAEMPANKPILDIAQQPAETLAGRPATPDKVAGQAGGNSATGRVGNKTPAAPHAGRQGGATAGSSGVRISASAGNGRSAGSPGKTAGKGNNAGSKGNGRGAGGAEGAVALDASEIAEAALVASEGPEWYREYVGMQRERLMEAFTSFPDPKKRLFLVAYAETGNMTVSALYAGVTRQTAGNWRDADPLFEAAMAVCKEAALDLMEESVRQRGLVGTMEPVFYQGRIVSMVRKFSDTLAIFTLKAERPLKFRDNPPFGVGIQAMGNVKISFNVPRPGGGKDKAEDTKQFEREAVIEIEGAEVVDAEAVAF